MSGMGIMFLTMFVLLAISGIMLPEMARAGYNKTYATALTAVAGSLGIIVPPSSPMVVFGVTNNVSIGALFMGGFGPAIVVGVLLMIINYIYCKKHGYKGSGVKVTPRGVFLAFKDAIWALLMPLIFLMIFGLMIIVGMLMQSTPAILLFSPILMQVATTVGINEVLFGVFMVVALDLGFVTPPVAMNLFVAQIMTGINIVHITRKAWPFIIALIAATLIIMYVPQITLLPLRLLGIAY